MVELTTLDYENTLSLLHQNQKINVVMISLMNQFFITGEINAWGDYEKGALNTVLINRKNKMYVYSNKHVVLRHRDVKNQIKYINGIHDIFDVKKKQQKNFHKRVLYYAELKECNTIYQDDHIKEISSVRELRKYYELLHSIDEVDLIKYPTKEAFITNLIEEIEHQFIKIVVYEKEGKYVSTLSVKAENEFGAMIKKVATQKEYRHQGYASRLLKCAASELVNNKKKRLYLFFENKTLATLYEQIGFTIIDKWSMLVRK